MKKRKNEIKKTRQLLKISKVCVVLFILIYLVYLATYNPQKRPGAGVTAIIVSKTKKDTLFADWTNYTYYTRKPEKGGAISEVERLFLGATVLLFRDNDSILNHWASVHRDGHSYDTAKFETGVVVNFKKRE